MEIFFFFNLLPKAKKRISKWGLSKLKKKKKEMPMKESINKTKRQPTELEKIFTSAITGKRLIFKLYLCIHIPYDSSSEKKCPIKNEQKKRKKTKKWAEDLNRHFYK